MYIGERDKGNTQNKIEECISDLALRLACIFWYDKGKSGQIEVYLSACQGLQ